MVDQADQWEHRMAAVNGINIHYVIEGQGDPVVFIHGWPEFWYGWRRQIPVMSARYQLIVPYRSVDPRLGKQVTSLRAP